MQVAPKDVFESIEFDKVLLLLEQKCYGDLGIEAVRAIHPDTNRLIIERKLNEVAQYKRSQEEADMLPMTAYQPINQELRMLEVIDYVLPEDGLKRLNIVLRFVQRLFTYFDVNRRKAYPALYDIIRDVRFDDELVKAIEKVIDAEGSIRPNASPDLQRLRRATISKQQELERVFRRLINSYRSNGWLTDNVESFRNGRRVLSVPAEHKRKIRGIIHDESTTGKTAFIEPEPVIDINNDIFDLITEEKREIYRILKALSATLRPYVPLMRTYQELIGRFDLIQAKSDLAMKMNAEKPKLKDHPNLGIQMGRHPLLLLKNKDLERETVPFDLELFGKNRILVVSGPNAGGKSILMKSVGLMQVMLQSGMLVPCDEISEFGVFEKLFADIGDQQSLEDDLSTYSSRLKNAKNFLEEADNKTLLLIDEFGSGTDPKIGGAIAEAVLHELQQKRIFGVITTHYSNLKVYAFKTPGIVNGSMLFNKENLSPTYQLKVGRPGSSYAFEIAQKSGLSKKILAYARKKTGKNEKAVDELLVDLQREKQETEQALARVSDSEKKLDKLIKNYEVLHKDLEYRRKKIKLAAKEQELQSAAEVNRDMEQLVREIKEERNLEKAKKLAAKIRQERIEKARAVNHLQEEIYTNPNAIKRAKAAKKGDIQVGDHVRLRSGGATGTVKSIDKKRAIVQMGIMNLEVKLRDLQHANAPLEVKSTKSVQMNTTQANANFNPKLDIRGMRMDEALKTVEVFVDEALISSASHLQILHGKGSGALRKAVRMKLKEYKAVQNVSHPKEEFGGNGITNIEIG